MGVIANKMGLQVNPTAKESIAKKINTQKIILFMIQKN